MRLSYRSFTNAGRFKVKENYIGQSKAGNCANVAGKCQSSLLTRLVVGDRIWGCRGNYASNIRERFIM